MSVDDRYTALKNRLEGQVSFSERKASLSHYASIGLTLAALICTVTAAVLGIFSSATAKTVGGMAALPAVIAGIAQSLKLDATSSWHYRKAVKTRALLDRLRLQGPEPMTIEYVSSISAEFNSLDQRMAEERQAQDRPVGPAHSGPEKQ